ncbi:MAG: hypothetical protein LBC37_05905 [Zoogloeaceae bacterium]|jgi:hypothetical protein|nr:hypothetical protein [Zoogloeaceae bacterium]
MRKFPRCLALCLFLPLPGAAQTSALPEGTPAAIRRDLATVQRYHEEVARHLNDRTRSANGAHAGTNAANPAPSRAAPPSPETSTAREIPERDPFEVSPRLLEARPRSRLPTGDSAALARNLRLRALARGPAGGVAQIQSGRELLTVHDGDELDVDGIRYTVRLEADGLVLRGAGAPQYRLQVR